jgi:hypothetical protein
MKISTSILLSGSIVIASARPQLYPRVDLSYTQYAPSPSPSPSTTTFDFAYLNRPMHTTALMAGEAWMATREAETEAEATRTESLRSRPTGVGEVEEQVEL